MNYAIQEPCQIDYFDIHNPVIATELSDCILKYMTASQIESCTPVILCIGTDRATGDCLGPLVGAMLENYNQNFQVLGTLSNPVHALNLHDTIRYIENNIKNPYVIAVDAALGESSHIGFVTVSDCPIAPGKGVNKKLPVIGDVSITGIVNVSGKSPNLLQSTRLHLVMELARCIADALKYSIDCTTNYFVPL